jgi:peroxiredoxin
MPKAKKRNPMRETHCRSRSLVLSLIFLFGIVFLAGGSAQNAEPALELPDHTGQLQRLADYRGKVVVLNFWATWCGPCAAEMSIFVETHRRYSARGVVVLAASLDAEETKAKIPAFIEKHKMEFPVLVGATTDHLQQFGMGEGLPGTVFLDPEGRIFARILGSAKKRDVFARVDWLLGDRRPKDKEPKPLLGKPLPSP